MKKDIKIAISGKSGCGNTTVSTLLAKRLGLTLVNYTFRSLAEELGISFKDLCLKAEEDPQYDYKVDETQLGIGKKGNCVLGSRLAIWLFKEADLKVFLSASLETRASRILKRDGRDLKIILEETSNRDARDHRRYKKLYGIDTNDYGFVDLVIDADKKSPEEIVELIAARVEKV